MYLLLMNFPELFHIEASVMELVLRGTIIYIGILLLLRILPHRTGGEIATMDLVFILLIAEGATHSFGEYSSLTEGFIVIGTLAGWNYLINVLSYHSKFVEKLVSPPAVQVIKNGRMEKRIMRREYLTEEELIEHLRSQGIEDVSKVKKAFLESDGSISVIKS